MGSNLSSLYKRKIGLQTFLILPKGLEYTYLTSILVPVSQILKVILSF